VPGDLLAERVRVPRDLPQPVSVTSPPFTDEQLTAVERRDGDLLLDANAGSGKTSVLVERFVRSVLNDGVEVTSILAITFTEKAAAELRERIRERLRAVHAEDPAHATDRAWISTIHSFCARVLRANALLAGIDPSFTVLDELESQRLAGPAFDAAIEDAAQLSPDAIELLAGYGVPALRFAIGALHGELRSRGLLSPALPPIAPAPALDEPREALLAARAQLAAELGALSPTATVQTALERLERCASVVAPAEPWPSDLDEARLPGGNGTSLATRACVAYREELDRFKQACAGRHAVRAHRLLDALLVSFGVRYAELKRERSALDFADLELLTRDLLRGDRGVRERYAGRFAQIMVDELQDTNPVQLELIESIARQNLFTVGDALQSIYGFRHADVTLFERRRAQLAERGRHATLAINFRSRREILDALNIGFAPELGERFTPLLAGRADAAGDEPRVELLIVDRAADWIKDELAVAWRAAEARVLAGRIRALLRDGASARDVVVLTRATTDLRAYERALEDLGIPTYMIGGRGYWSHPQVIDVVAYLSALANPLDGEALYTVLASPLVGCSSDALVVLAAAGRSLGRDPWWVLREPEGSLDGLDPVDRSRLERFAAWFAAERTSVARSGIEELIERALEQTGYDLAMLAMPGGERRLANVRKLMRLGREHESAEGRDLQGFVELVRERSGASSDAPGDSRESEAPVEGEALDAVRLMTIHRAKGLEFEIVCVADLGREPRYGAELVRVAGDGRLGLMLARPGTGRRVPALDYDALGAERAQAEASEERRLFYVAMTRARERLILSGAGEPERWAVTRGGGPMRWIAPALIPDIAKRAADGELSGVVERSAGEWQARIAYRLIRPQGEGAAPTEQARMLDEAHALDEAPAPRDAPAPHEALAPERPAIDEPAPGAEPGPAPPISTLSYTSLGEYERCGYRFYLERVLGLRGDRGAAPPGEEDGNHAERGGLSAAERGVIAHALLEELDFRRPAPPDDGALAAAAARAGASPTEAEARELIGLVEGFASSALGRRLADVREIRREEPFGFLLEAAGGVLVNGVLDVLAREQDQMLVVDYKSDRLDGRDPQAVAAAEYGTQRLVYALAALRAGAAEVEVVHVFLELPERPGTARFSGEQLGELERELAGVARGVLAREFTVSPAPHRALCHGCPGEGGLCSWPLALTRREAPDRLF
jgi:ATP-dependent exoDNAse (exonuclease V) beta subunit